MRKVYFNECSFDVSFDRGGELATINDLENLIYLGYNPIEGELLELKDGIYWWVDESIIGEDFCGYILIRQIKRCNKNIA